jgi:hypothetical protein
MNASKPSKTSRRAHPPRPAAEAVLHTNLPLVEVADPLLLEELRADRQLGPLLLAQLSDCVAVVKPGGGEQVMRALLKAGHTPKVINP